MELWPILVIFLCILSEAFFSGSEIAIVSLPKLELQKRLKEGDRRAKLLAELLKEPEKLLTTTLIGTNLSTVTGSAVFTTFIMDDLVNATYADLWGANTKEPLSEVLPRCSFQNCLPHLLLLPPL